MTAALFFLKDVDLCLELGVRGDRAGLRDDLSALDVLTVDAAEKDTGVVAALRAVERLTEHFYTGDDRGLRRFDTDYLDGIADLDLTAFDTTRSDCATAGYREYVLDGHKEGLVDVARRGGDIAVDRVHKLHYARASGIVRLAALRGFERFESAAANDGRAVAVEVVFRKEFADFHLDEVEHFGIIHLIGLVHEDGDLGNADLTRENDVLAGLRHDAVGSCNDEDSAVHLSRARYHVFNIVRVPRAVHVRVVTVSRLVLDVRGVDGDTARLLFGRFVDLIVTHLLSQAFGCKHHGDRRGKRGLAVVNVADRADVDVRFASVEFSLSHFVSSGKFYLFFEFVLL